MVIGMHFMNPVPIMKLVEIIRGYNTSDEVTTIIMELSRTLGKIPTEVNDYPGFVANRILMPMIMMKLKRCKICIAMLRIKQNCQLFSSTYCLLLF